MPESKPTAAAPSPKPKSRPGVFRWGLAIVLLALAAWAGWHTYRVFAQRRVAEHIDDLGGLVYYDYQDVDADARARESSEPGMIASVLGNDYTHDIVEVNLRITDRKKLSDDDLRKVSGLSAVRKLSLSNGGEITDDGMAALAHMPHIEKLQLVKFPELTDSGLTVLAKLPALRRLELVTLPKITDEALQHVAELENLQELVIANCQINGSGWRYLKPAALRILEVNACPIDDEALKHLAQADNLQELAITQGKIAGAGLAHLKGLSNLRLLRLGDNPLDPAIALPHLKALTSLKLLNLASTKIDRQAGEELAKALPECDITIDAGSYDPDEKKWSLAGEE